MGTSTEVLESLRIGTVTLSAEWNHSSESGQVSLAGDPDSALVLLGTVTSEEDLVDLFDEFCELFERMSLKGILTLHTV